VGSMILLDLVGGVSLLLWGLHMVRSGIVRAFGSDLRRFLGVALSNRFLAFAAGIFVTALLQSSTATGLMTASFVTGGAVDLVPALAIMLGANVGTTLIVQVLSFDVSAVAPVLFLIGVTAFKRGGQTRTRDLIERDGHRAMEIISFSINLEHVGDIIDKNLMELAAKKIKRKVVFSKEGAAELESFHQEVCDNLKLAFSVFMSGDVKIARQLITEKAALRATEFAAAESHFARLREGRAESIESSSLHLDILRDLKRIHSHICSVAYPVLERTGELQPSRLKEIEPDSGFSAAGDPAASAPSPKR
jgi:Na+/phosphate symporter